MELRRYAIDRLIEHDPAAFKREADGRITEVNAWPALQYIFEQAAKRHWRDFVPIAVRSYARPSTRFTDRQRPEHALIASLYPQRSVDDVVYEVFVGIEPAYTAAHQASAWTVLSRLLSEPERRARLEAARRRHAIGDGFAGRGRAAGCAARSRGTGVVADAPGAMSHGKRWRQMVAKANQLNAAQRQGLALRHLPLLLQVNDQTLAMDREMLSQRITQRLAARQHVTRVSRVPEGWSEAFADQQAALPWGDLLTIDVLQRTLQQPTTRQAPRRAQRDREDQRSEAWRHVRRHLARLDDPTLRARIPFARSSIHRIRKVDHPAIHQPGALSLSCAAVWQRSLRSAGQR